MSNKMEDLLISESHEWVKKESEKIVYVGITDFAQAELGSVVFVDLPEVGTKLVKGEAFGAVESVKAASDLMAPVSGEILEVNEDLIGEPELVNENAYEAWMLKIEVDDSEDYASLLTKSEYDALR